MGVTLMSEDFESGLGAWTAMVSNPPSGPDNDTPMLFSATDPLLYTNTGNPGSTSAGYSSDLAVYDDSQAEWIQRQFPSAVAAGTYQVRLELDLYVYRADGEDPWGVGNRIYLLTDNQYNNPGWDFQASAAPGFRRSYWPYDTEPANSGIWQHVVVDYELVTATGNIEVRLLQHDKHEGAQAVAWDNVTLTVVPEPASLALLSLGLGAAAAKRRRS
jgi:hypothetical protein